MSKKYTNTTTGFTLVSGTLKELGEDRKTGIIEAEVWDKSEKKRVLEDIKISAEAPIEENVGDVVTAYGYNFKGTIMIDVISKDAMYHEIEPTVENKKGVAVLAGNVLFAVKNDEIDKTTGEPRLNNAGQPRKPHFDISLPVGQGENRVLHTVKIYDFKERTDKDGTVIPAQKNIERYEKLFKNFMEDKANHPIYVSIRTQPGQLYTVDTPAVYSKGPKQGQPILSKETGEQIIWHNKRMSHLGANAIDVTFLQVAAEKEKQGEEKAATSAPAIKEESVKEEASGFEAGNFSMEGFEEFPEMEDFTID